MGLNEVEHLKHLPRCLVHRKYPRSISYQPYYRGLSFPIWQKGIMPIPVGLGMIGWGSETFREHSQPATVPVFPTPKYKLFPSIPQPLRYWPSAIWEVRFVLNPRLKRKTNRGRSGTSGMVFRVSTFCKLSQRVLAGGNLHPGLLQPQHPSGSISTPRSRAGKRDSKLGCWSEPYPHMPEPRSVAGRPPATSFSGQITLSLFLSKPSNMACETLRPPWSRSLTAMICVGEGKKKKSWRKKWS